MWAKVDFENMSFSPLNISTITVCIKLPCQFNIVDIANYLPLDDNTSNPSLIGVKTFFADKIIRRGVVNEAKTKEILNQVTIAGIFGERRITVKLFYNGSCQIAGSHTLEQAHFALDFILNRLQSVEGNEKVKLDSQNGHALFSEGILYSTGGDIIGQVRKDALIIKKDPSYTVDLQQHETTLGTFWVFVEKEWQLKPDGFQKKVFTTDGDYVGAIVLDINRMLMRRTFKVVEDGYIDFHGKIIGKQKVILNDASKQLLICETEKTKCFAKKTIERSYLATNFKGEIDKSLYQIHMINAYFCAPFKIKREALHDYFIRSGYDSRFDSDRNSGVNFRYKFNDGGNGKCTCKVGVGNGCQCKVVSIRCFNSGKMNVCGLNKFEQGKVVYEFIKSLFNEHPELKRL